jgi:hypothetical protein
MNSLALDVCFVLNVDVLHDVVFLSALWQLVVIFLNETDAEIVDSNFRWKTVDVVKLLWFEINMKIFQHFDLHFAI